MMCRGCVTTKKSVVRLVTAGWKSCVWVCDIDTGLVDLGRSLNLKSRFSVKKGWAPLV